MKNILSVDKRERGREREKNKKTKICFDDIFVWDREKRTSIENILVERIRGE